MGFFKNYAKQMNEQGKQNREQLKNLGKAFIGQKNVVDLVKGAPFSNIDTSIVNMVDLESLLQSYSAEKKEFTLQGEILTVSKEIDMEINYPIIYSKAADIFAKAFAKECNNVIDNIDYWIIEVVNIYNKYLKMMADKTVNIIVANGIYSETVNNILKLQKNSFNEFDTFYANVSESLSQVKPNVQQQKMDWFSGDADVSNNPLAQSLINKVSSLDLDTNDVVGQTKNKVYTNMLENQDEILSFVKHDYANMAKTLLYTMQQNGIAVKPVISQEDGNKANALFENIQRDTFPQDKIPEALCSIIKLNYNDPRYFDFMKQKFGDTEEVRKIAEYFIHK